MHSRDGLVYLQLSSAASYFLQRALRRGEEKHTQEINHRAQQTPSFRTTLSTNSYSRRILRFRKNKENQKFDSIASLLADTDTFYVPESDSDKWCFPS